MNTNAQVLAEAIKQALGPQWWAAKVAVAVQQANFGIAMGIIIGLVLLVGTLILMVAAFKINDRRGDQLVYATLTGAVGAVAILFVSGLIIGASYETLASPDLHVWQELVLQVSAVLR